MPSKRQPSKQRRAAQNRARTQALAARREAASQTAVTASSSSASSSGGSTGARRSGGLLGGLLGGGASGGGSGGLFGGGARGGGGATGVRTASGRPPGTLALWIALGLGVVSFVLFALSQVPVDDRDEPLPQNGLRFQAVYLAARGILTGDQVRARDVSVFDAHGPAVIIYGLVPLAILAAVFIAFRRSPTSRPLTIGMLAMAVVVLLVGGYTFMYSLIALAVGSFQARRAEVPARMAERAAQREAAAEQDENEYDDEDEYLDEDEELDDEDLADDEELDDEDLEDDEADLDDEDEELQDVVEVDEEPVVAEDGAPVAEEPAPGDRKR